MKNGYCFKETKTTEGKVKFIILAPGYMVDRALMAYTKELTYVLAESSRRAYLIQLMKWLNFLHQDGSSKKRLSFDPATLRHKIYLFLTREYSCQINFARFHEDAFLVKESGVKNGRAAMFLAAISHFYKIMYRLKLYPFNHALKIPSEETQKDAEEKNERLRMPLISGCVSPASNNVLPYRLSNNYFVCVDNEWKPKTLDCADFPALMLEGGRKIGWSIREFVIFRMLFETGARISEILGLTLADWVKFSCKETANIFSKGSNGARVKNLSWNKETTKLLKNYFNSMRRDMDPSGRTLNEYISKHDESLFLKTPLFINKHGRGMLANSYRSQYWNPAAKSVGIKATPHQARHWFVTSYMRGIFSAVGTTDLNNADVARAIEGLIAYMKWSSGEEMIKTYNHHLSKETVINYQSQIHASFQKSLEVDLTAVVMNESQPAVDFCADERFKNIFDLVGNM